MTNEEAIKHITTWLYAAPDLPPMQVVQALELAVAALSAGVKDMHIPTMPVGQPLTLEFDVVDTMTGEYPDWERIAREEAWANGLIYCDMDGVAILEDGSLILLDECGNCVPCPPDRFEIRRRPPEEEA